MNIDLLICSQDYWNFIGYKQARGKSGPIAISSRLGFVLSGPNVNDQNNANYYYYYYYYYYSRITNSQVNLHLYESLIKLYW